MAGMVSVWRVGDATVFDLARDATGSAIAATVRAPRLSGSTLREVIRLRGALYAVDGFDRAATDTLYTQLQNAPAGTVRQ